MYVNDQKLSVSLVSVEFLAEGTGTQLRVTEQGAFLLDEDDASDREQGTVWLRQAGCGALQPARSPLAQRPHRIGRRRSGHVS